MFLEGVSVCPKCDGRCLSWSARATLSIWDTNAGALLTTLPGHTVLVPGTLLLPQARILNWSDDHTLRL